MSLIPSRFAVISALERRSAVHCQEYSPTNPYSHGVRRESLFSYLELGTPVFDKQNESFAKDRIIFQVQDTVPFVFPCNAGLCCRYLGLTKKNCVSSFQSYKNGAIKQIHVTGAKRERTPAK